MCQKSSFNTNLIIYDDASYDSSPSLHALGPYTFPVSFAEAKFSYTATWNYLEDENMNIHNLLDPNEFDQFKIDNNVGLEYNSTGKLLYIGSHDFEGIQKAKAKLDVILSFRVSIPYLNSCTWIQANTPAEIVASQTRAPLVHRGPRRDTPCRDYGRHSLHGQY